MKKWICDEFVDASDFFFAFIYLKTFKTGLDVLVPDKRKGEDIGYG